MTQILLQQLVVVWERIRLECRTAEELRQRDEVEVQGQLMVEVHHRWEEAVRSTSENTTLSRRWQLVGTKSKTW